jgi:nucleoid-associated protein YgaU
MGTFEKLGILVIVVIIVMILAVAIYQWGGAATEPSVQTPDLPDPLTIRYLEELEAQATEPEEPANASPAPDADTWSGGIPRIYTIQPNDMVWNLVVKRWKLKHSFIPAIAAANPAVDMKRLRPGHRLVIPDPAHYVRGQSAGRDPGTGAAVRLYEVKVGDRLEDIALLHLGSRKRHKDILALNPGLNPKRLMPGQKLYLPAK